MKSSKYSPKHPLDELYHQLMLNYLSTVSTLTTHLRLHGSINSMTLLKNLEQTTKRLKKLWSKTPGLEIHTQLFSIKGIGDMEVNVSPKTQKTLRKQQTSR